MFFPRSWSKPAALLLLACMLLPVVACGLPAPLSLDDLLGDPAEPVPEPAASTIVPAPATPDPARPTKDELQSESCSDWMSEGECANAGVHRYRQTAHVSSGCSLGGQDPNAQLTFGMEITADGLELSSIDHGWTQEYRRVEPGHYQRSHTAGERDYQITVDLTEDGYVQESRYFHPDTGELVPCWRYERTLVE